MNESQSAVKFLDVLYHELRNINLVFTILKIDRDILHFLTTSDALKQG